MNLQDNNHEIYRTCPNCGEETDVRKSPYCDNCGEKVKLFCHFWRSNYRHHRILHMRKRRIFL